MPHVRVLTPNGPVVGRQLDGVQRFLGIPYAAPPVGEFRLLAPQPVKPWTDDFNAERYGPHAPGIVRAPSTGRSGDDWLNLNVWTPDVASGPLPVVVWIHGGGFMMGSSDDGGVYDGAAFARQGVVFVSINYRVAVEGFVQLTGAPANRGLLDQVAALTWVRDSIGAFGGDPDQVTIMGQSAGAGSVLHLMAMPSARGLFHRAIAMSIPRMCLDPHLAADAAKVIGRTVGLPSTREAFASRDPYELGLASAEVIDRIPRYALRWSRSGGIAIPFAPVVDGEVVPRDPWVALREGTSADIPLLTGYTRDEGKLFRVSFTGDFSSLPSIGRVRALVTAWLMAPRRRLRAFRSVVPGETYEQLHDRAFTDGMLLSSTMHTALAHTTGGGRTYVYLMHVDPPGGVGSPHAVELPLLFDHYEGLMAELFTPHPDDEALQRTAARLRASFVDFVKTGEPGWPAWDEQRQVQIFGDGDPVAPYPDDARLRLTLTDPCRPSSLR